MYMPISTKQKPIFDLVLGIMHARTQMSDPCLLAFVGKILPLSTVT